jgi:hypothetical protein
MSVIEHRIRTFAIAGALCLGLSRIGTALMADTTATVIIETVDVAVYRTKEPLRVPAAKQERKGRAPSANATWVPGFWNLRADRYAAPRAGWDWVPGRWLTPPVKDARWDPAHWGWSDEWWSWIPGHGVRPGPHGYPPSLQSDEISADQTDRISQ